MKRFAMGADDGGANWSLSASLPAERSNLFEPIGRQIHHQADRDFITLHKGQPGFTPRQIAEFRQTIDAAAEGAFGEIRYLVMDLASGSPAGAADDPAFLELAGAVETLVRWTTIIPVACVRGQVAGADLELALTANILVSDAKALFSFAAEPTSALGLYGTLARKLGFVSAERLMDQAKTLTAEEMAALFLVKEVLDLDRSMDALWSFLARIGRRHNSSYAIYRAQCMAAPSIYKGLTLNT
jgi:enoyl-CoA hydratase/carnithine racemase